MLDIAEISAAPHLPRALQAVLVRGRENVLSELLSALCGMHDIAIRELNGELHIVRAANPSE